MRTAVGNLGKRRIAVARGTSGESLVFENARNQIADICLVIDNQNITSHGFPLSCQLPVAASIFVLSWVVSGGSAVSSLDCVIPPSGFVCALAAWPDIAKRSRIHAPRAPGRISDASCSS